MIFLSNSKNRIHTLIYRCEKEMQVAVGKYIAENGLQKDAKLFVVIGHYDDIRQEML